MTNSSFQGALPLVRIEGARVRTTGVCTLVVPELPKLAFSLSIFEILGAEGGTPSNTLFLAVLQGFFNFLRKTAFLNFRTDRTSRTLRTRLYLSCSQLVPDFSKHRWSNFPGGKSVTSKNADAGFSVSALKAQRATLNKPSKYTSIGHARIIRHDRCTNPRRLAYGWQLLPPPHITLIRLPGINMAAKEFTRIPTDPNEREEFDRQYMTPKELAQRWRVSESAIHHRKAGSNNLPRYYFGRAVRFIRQDVYDFENQKIPLPLL